MSTTGRIRSRTVSAVVALALLVAAPRALSGQGATPTPVRAENAAGFKEFANRVKTYLQLRKTVESDLPALKSTDLPEMITAYQQALARKLREARPHAKPGDIFTHAASEAFGHVIRAALAGPTSSKSREYMQPDSASADMRLIVNGIYPETEPITTISPELLAAFPPLPVELAYRVVGRSLLLVDVKSRLIVDVARQVLPPAS